MRIGLDVDGVLANFYAAYEALTIKVDGRNLFGKKRWPNALPEVWDWPEAAGYSAETMKQVWKEIKESETFWLRLSKLEHVNLKRIEEGHILHFITDRPGETALWLTNRWLNCMYGVSDPDVRISSRERTKGDYCRNLDLDIYADDKLENILDVQEKSPATRAYLILRPYNCVGAGSNAVNLSAYSVGDMLQQEGLSEVAPSTP